MDFRVEQGKVYGEPYHYVAVDRWDNAHLIFPMVQWCEETFGVEFPQSTWTPGKRWYVANYNSFWFRDEADITLFLLRWA